MDHAVKKLCFVVCLLVYAHPFSNTHFVNSSATETKCSASAASDNVKWSKIERKCVICPECQPGYFRNLSEPRTRRKGIYGDEQCLQCRPCPEGKYSKNGKGECIKCRMNCTEINREYAGPCSSKHDAKCDRCLYGNVKITYECTGSMMTYCMDTFKNKQFPCSAKRSLRLLDTSVNHPGKLQNRPENSLKLDEHAVEASVHHEDGKGKISRRTITIITGAASLILLSVVMVLMVMRTRSSERHYIEANPPGPYTPVFDLSRDNDIEMDTFREDIVQKTHRQQNDAVRPELREAEEPSARPELSQPATTLQLNGIVQSLQLSDGSVVSFQRKKDICNCRVQQQCKCELYALPEHTLEKSDKYMLLVASEVCHDPFPLFRNLGLNDATLYQENTTRDRDPENITQKELVIRLLNIWVEIKSSQATLHELSHALCEAKFHNITRNIYELSNNI